MLSRQRQAYRRKEVRSAHSCGGTRLIKAGDGGFKLLVVLCGSGFQITELRVVIYLPPFALRQMGCRRGSAPSDVLEFGRRFGGRALIVWTDLSERAGAEEEWDEKAHEKVNILVLSVQCGRFLLFAQFHHENIEHRREEQAEESHADHASKYGGAHGAAHLSSGSGADDKRVNASDEGDGGHQNGAQSQAAGFESRIENALAVIVVLFGKLDDEDGVFARESDQDDEANVQDKN